MLTKFLMAGAVAATVCMAPLAATAGILGTTVDAATYYPDQGSVFLDGGAAVVGAGVEYGAGTFPGYNSSLAIDLSDSQIDISIGETYFSDADFNGIGITFGAVVPIGATIAGGSDFSPVGISFAGNTLFLNYQGQSGGGHSFINLQFADANGGAPEPASWALMILGFGATGAAMRSRRRAISAAA